MKILITGGAGFIGSHIAEYYSKQGCEIVLFDNMSGAQFLPKSGKTYDYVWENLTKNAAVTRIPGDIRDYESLESAAEETDIIFHTAAHTNINASFQDPAEDLSVNLLGAFNVLEVARALPKNPAIIYLSTSKIYGAGVNRLDIVEQNGISRFTGQYENGVPENFPVDGHGRTPFGTSKLAADLYFQEYSHLYGLKTGVFRLSAVYGPRQFGFEEQSWPVKMILDIMLGRPVSVEGSGNIVRDLLYIDDLIPALDAFVKSEYRQCVFNIGGGRGSIITPLKLAELLEKKLQRSFKLDHLPALPYEQRVFYSDNSKISKILGWSPSVGIEKGIGEVIEWVVKNRKLFD
jgi:CDP-paratose 2-epimerase